MLSETKSAINIALAVLTGASCVIVALTEMKLRKRQKELDLKMEAIKADIRYHEQLVIRYNYFELMLKLRVLPPDLPV